MFAGKDLVVGAGPEAGGAGVFGLDGFAQVCLRSRRAEGAEGGGAPDAGLKVHALQDEAQEAEVAVITGLTEEGRGRAQLTIPSTYEGRQVTMFEAAVFQNDADLSRVIIPGSIRMIYDGSFSGCTRLQEIRLLHTVPCGVGTDLFAGTEGFRVCVPASALELFATHYNWGAYKDYLSGYEG